MPGRRFSANLEYATVEIRRAIIGCNAVCSTGTPICGIQAHDVHFQVSSAAADHAIHNLILCGSLTGPFLLITALLPHMFIISLMTFTKVWIAVGVEAFGSDFCR